MIVMEGAVSRQLSALSENRMSLNSMGSTKKKGAGLSGVRLIQL
jgi:hypothetical protein